MYQALPFPESDKRVRTHAAINVPGQGFWRQIQVWSLESVVQSSIDAPLLS